MDDEMAPREQAGADGPGPGRNRGIRPWTPAASSVAEAATAAERVARAIPRLHLAGRALSAAALAALACGGDADIEKPTPRFTDSPVEYPLELWDQDIEGSTLVRVLVNEEGGVDTAMVMTSSGHSELDSAAVQGALSMEFDPATREGEPLRVWARVPVHFSKDARPGTPGGTGDPGGQAAPDTSTANPGATSGFGGPRRGSRRRTAREPAPSSASPAPRRSRCSGGLVHGPRGRPRPPTRIAAG